ncbi:hypothetical protein P171DRAFT_68322 [Karstenula rhodostoma CBS 690.94]|uniref:Uncharacterized protein n=1 Tax=Karstenula rhodostoma CBS 690.94 TaxID=1392251 RepID=A0A9P4PCH2_9PLEO|nr:hypothetical protein P171DRAFT_68322 [Karstenula rhodostoma CBS 690.94]
MLDGVFFTTKETNFFFRSLHRPVRVIYYPDLPWHCPRRSPRRLSRSSGSRDYPLHERFSSFSCKSMWAWGYLFALFELAFPYLFGCHVDSDPWSVACATIIRYIHL